jgi:peptidoglycan hydrolase CwlO-like protein
MAGFINVPLLSTFNDAGIRKAQSQLGGLSAILNNIGRSALAATAGFASINSAVDFIGSSVTQARDAERNFAALGSVFGDLAPQMQDFANNANSIGLSNVDAAKASTFLGSVLKQAGFDMDTVAGQTQNLVGLASDLAITYGYDVSEALTGMTALFRGEYDPIEKFGVAMKQSEVNAVLAANGQDGLTGAARRNAEQMARLALLYQRTQDAQGAYARGAGTLFVEQTNLQTAMADMKQTLGEQLIPAFASVAQQMVPIVTNLGPSLRLIFEQVAIAVGTLAPYLPKIAAALTEVLTFVTGLFQAFNFLLPLITENLTEIIVFIATFKTINALIPIVEGLRVQLALMKLEIAGGAAATQLLGVNSKNATGGVAALAKSYAPLLAALAATVVLYSQIDGYQQAEEYYASSKSETGTSVRDPKARQFLDTKGTNTPGNKYGPVKKELTDAEKAIADAKKQTDEFMKSLEELLAKFAGAGEDIDKGSKEVKKTAADYIKSFYDGLSEETAKQRVRLQLEGKASKGLIDYILGSDNWMTVWTSIKKDLDKNLKSLESQFKNTAAGVAEMAAAKKEAADKAQELQDKLDALKESLNSAADGFRSIGKESNLGQFESETVTALQNIEDALKKAFNSKEITQSAYTELKNYATRETVVLRDIAKQRDAIAKKRSIVESVLSSLKSSFYSAANIATKLEAVTTQVTESSVQMIDGIQLTISSTRDVTAQTGDIVSNFATIVSKTKNFVAVLKQLKAQGLNAELFQQIVDAGVESGTATAEGILAGGPGTITELNNLFEELRIATGDAVDVTAGVMLEAGKDVTSSLLEGIKAEEYRLQELAQAMATSFADAFAAAVALAIQNIKLPQVGTTTVGAASMDMYDVAKALAPSAQDYFSTSEYINQARIAQRNNAPIQVTVNAGLGTDGTSVGEAIVNEILRYEKTSGAVFTQV